MSQYILNTFNSSSNNIENDLDIIVYDDDYITALASLLNLKFTIDTLPTQYVNAHSGLLFILDKGYVKIQCLGLTIKKKYVISNVLKKISLKKFTKFVKTKINNTYVNLTEIDNTITYRTK